MSSYVSAAIKLFGLTTDPRKGGFILADGRMLNFTVGTERDRSRDHREVCRVLRSVPATSWDGVQQFMKATGACRFMPEVVGFEFATRPTIPQFRQMQRCIELLYSRQIAGGTQAAVLEMNGPRGRHFYHEYTARDIRRLYADVVKFWGR